MIELDYQLIINLLGEYLRAALPIAIIFGLAGKATNLFLSLAFGKERVDL